MSFIEATTHDEEGEKGQIKKEEPKKKLSDEEIAKEIDGTFLIDAKLNSKSFNKDTQEEWLRLFEIYVDNHKLSPKIREQADDKHKIISSILAIAAQIIDDLRKIGIKAEEEIEAIEGEERDLTEEEMEQVRNDMVVELEDVLEILDAAKVGEDATLIPIAEKIALVWLDRKDPKIIDRFVRGRKLIEEVLKDEEETEVA